MSCNQVKLLKPSRCPQKSAMGFGFGSGHSVKCQQPIYSAQRWGMMMLSGICGPAHRPSVPDIYLIPQSPPYLRIPRVVRHRWTTPHPSVPTWRAPDCGSSPCHSHKPEPICFLSLSNLISPIMEPWGKPCIPSPPSATLTQNPIVSWRNQVFIPALFPGHLQRSFSLPTVSITPLYHYYPLSYTVYTYLEDSLRGKKKKIQNRFSSQFVYVSFYEYRG